MAAIGKRVHAFDILKFVVMIGVIAGHIVNAKILDDGGQDWGCPYINNTIVSISMPIFFIISGYFSRKRLLNDCCLSKSAARVICLLWPLFSFGIVFSCILYFIGSISLITAMLYPFKHIIYGGWFLMALAVCYAIVAIICLLVRNNWIRVLVGLFICVLLLFVPKMMVPFFYFRLTYVNHMLPYFLFGAFFFERCNCLKAFNLCILGAIYFLVIFTEGSVSTNGMSFYKASLYWKDVVLDVHGLFCFFARPAVGVCGSIFFIELFARVEKIVPSLFAKIGVLGTTTLGVYVMHEWPLMRIGEWGLRIAWPIEARWAMALAILLFFHFLTLLIYKYRYIKMFFFGDEKVLSQYILKIFRVLNFANQTRS